MVVPSFLTSDPDGRYTGGTVVARAPNETQRTVGCVKLSFDELDDHQIAVLIGELQGEQQRRALANADPDALAQLVIREGFDAMGAARKPWLHSGLLLCPGSRIDKSASSHECAFVSIDGQWVWESEHTVRDVMTTTAERRVKMRTASIVAPHDGMEVTFVQSHMRSGLHQMHHSTTWVVRNGELHESAVKTARPRDLSHR